MSETPVPSSLVVPDNSDEGRRAPVQRSVGYGKPPGTVAWWEHVAAWDGYGEGNKREQDAERIAERGGFGYSELVIFLGHEPTTWVVRHVG